MTKKCLYCNAILSIIRTDNAKFCYENCRVKWYYRNIRIKRVQDIILNNKISELGITVRQLINDGWKITLTRDSNQ